MNRSLSLLLTLPAAALITYACGGANNSGVLPDGGAGETGTGGKKSGSGGTGTDTGGNDNAAGSDAGGGSGSGSGSGGGVATCSSDNDCTANDQVCDVPHLVCVECLTEADCAGTAECQDGTCRAFTPCASSKDCSTDQVCDKTLARCVECITTVDCGAGELCVASECRPTCVSDKDCSALGQVCDATAGHCLECLTSADCAASQNCGESSECVADICLSGSTQCSEDTLMTCNLDGTGFDQQACPDGCVTGDGPAHCDDGMLPGTCAGATADPCTSIPRLTVPQVVDGNPDEFCDIPYKLITPANAGFLYGPSSTATTPDGKTSQAQARIAWSPGYLHVYVRVVDPAIYVGTAGYAYSGDNVQLFATPAAPSVSGQLIIGSCFTPLTQEQQFLVPSKGVAAAFLQYSCTGWDPSPGPSPGQYEYVSKPTVDGYEVELKYPWAATTAGTEVGIDLLIGVNDTGTFGYEYGLHLNSPATSTCTGAKAPWCDPMLWCSPTLAP